MIKIGENQDKDVTYENEPESQRQLFPNIPLTVDVSPLQDAIDALDERMDDAESDIDSIMTTLQTFDGQPGVAETVSDMTDTNKIYVYVGSETGYTSGDWYYYDGTAWVSGGTYVANPVQIDDTLTQAGDAADAKVTGDEIAQIKSDLSELEPSIKLVSSPDDFTETTVYLEDGTETVESSRYTTPFIPCDDYNYLEYRLRGYYSTSKILALIVFFDEDYDFIYSVPSSSLVVTTGSTYIPEDAKYFRALWLKVASDPPYVIAYKKAAVNNKIQSLKNEAIPAVRAYIDLDATFDVPFVYDSTTEIRTTRSGRSTSELIKCNEFDRIIYSLTSFRDSDQTLDILTFLDKNMQYLSGLPSTGSNGTVKGEIDIPTGAVYVCGNKLNTSTDAHYMYGAINDSVYTIANNTRVIQNGGTLETAETQIVDTTMSINQFIAAVNAAWGDYADLCLAHTTSFNSIYPNADWQEVYEYLNHNFREEIAIDGISYDELCRRVNLAFTRRIRRFCDAKLNTNIPNDFSIAFDERSGEPSLIVSADGSTLHLFASNKRYDTEDGMTWAEPIPLAFDSAFTPEHVGVCMIDGTYFLIGPDSTEKELRLYTSTDGINFTYMGIPLKIGYEFISGETVSMWGNPYVIKTDGTYYLFIEARSGNRYWDIFLVTCTDPFVANEDGSIGNWQNNDVNPIIDKPFPHSSEGQTTGNPDFIKGMDNRPIHHDGKWYMLFHVTWNNYSYIFRGYSYDLRHWVSEGGIFDNRDTPTDGMQSPGNADQAIIEFKGRTYLFYTWDINSSHVFYIRYMIDDRPALELLRLRA